MRVGRENVAGTSGRSVETLFWNDLAIQIVGGLVKTSSDNAKSLKNLEERIGSPHLRQRLWLQSEHVYKKFGKGRTFIHFENFDWLHRVISGVVRLSGLYGKGSANSRNFDVTTNRIGLPGLPTVFAGFRILHLTDLHLDLDPSFPPQLQSKLKNLDYDLCVITGDFRAATFGDYRECLKKMSMIAATLKNPIYGVLGNHDFIEMVTPLEEMGIKLLLNEAIEIELQGDSIWLAGVDDPHFYQTDNLQKASEQISTESAAILMSHSPELYKQAAASGFDLMLCGHTHGGQICLPGGTPILTNGNCPRQYVAGKWKYRELSGYTSKGVGCSGVPVRFNCLPEIVLHVLEPAKVADSLVSQ